jgi:transcriptional regulator
MYIPKPFLVEDWKELTSFFDRNPAINLVTVGKDGTPLASLLPAVWKSEQAADGTYGTLITHISKGNPQWKEISHGQIGLAIVQGAQAYVSPTNYEKKLTNHKVVPTWNYQKLHLTGILEVSEDTEVLREIVSELTDFHEQGRKKPWSASESDPDYMNVQLQGIVAITMKVTKVETAFKMSQNRSDIDQTQIAKDLQSSEKLEERVIASEMKRIQNQE